MAKINMGKYYWCERCAKFPDQIIEQSTSVANVMRWDEGQGDYEVIDSESSGWEQLCFDCGDYVEFKDGKTPA